MARSGLVRATQKDRRRRQSGEQEESHDGKAGRGPEIADDQGGCNSEGYDGQHTHHTSPMRDI
jgi:hypothetical protein